MITEPYTLFTRIPIYADGDGRLLADDLWAHDLLAHLVYISDFRICCPVESVSAAPRECRPLPGLSLNQVTPLRVDRGWVSVVANLLPNFIGVVRALRATSIAHSSGAGWAFPLSFYILAVRPLLDFKWIMNIESSFWMMPPASKPTVRKWVRHHLHGTLLRRCIKSADARLFTQERYCDMFMPSREASLVSPAIWVNESDFLSDAEHARVLAGRSGGVKILFAARLIDDKGVSTVLAAAKELANTLPSDADFRLDIIGSGPLREECCRLAEAVPHIVRVLDPVPYGAPFFELLRGYDAVLLANRQSEQPRIVVDAFSQGVPCITSRTPGTESMVSENETGLFFDIDDVKALARCMQLVAERPDVLRGMSKDALHAGRNRTHHRMHQDRHLFLIETLGLGESDALDS